MARLIKVNESDPVKRRIYFDLRREVDGITPATNEQGGQPQISINGGPWQSTGIGTLVHIGYGRYYAELDPSVIATPGTHIETRYKGPDTADTPGDSVDVVAFDPTQGDACFGLGAILVDHNYGGPDNLRYTDPSGVPIDNARIYIYLKSDYDAGRTGIEYLKGCSETDVNGRWKRAVMLDPEIYSIVFFKQGEYGPDVVEVIVG